MTLSICIVWTKYIFRLALIMNENSLSNQNNHNVIEYSVGLRHPDLVHSQH